MLRTRIIILFLSIITSIPAGAEDGYPVKEVTEYIVHYSLVTYPKNNDPLRKLYTDLLSEKKAADFQKSLFPHKAHQRRLLTVFMGNKEESCRVCHHNKERGEKPKRCTGCHTSGFALRSLLKKQGRSLIFKGSAGARGFLNKEPGRVLPLQDAYHALCNGCHMAERGRNNNLWGQQKRAPILCDGCHMIY